MFPSTYIPDKTLGRYLNVPFNLPESEIQPDSSVVVALIELPPNSRLSLRWLSLDLLDVPDYLGIWTKVVTTPAPLYVGLYSDNFFTLNVPSGQPLVYLPAEAPGLVQIDPFNWPDFESPDTYGVILVNNTVSTRIRASVTGTFQVTRL